MADCSMSSLAADAFQKFKSQFSVAYRRSFFFFVITTLDADCFYGFS